MVEKSKLHIAAALLAVSLPHIAFAQTLCQKGEIDYFSCSTGGGKKSLSICGNIRDGIIDAGSWLQYRFGKPGKIELRFPTEKKGSVSKFEGNDFNKYDVVDLRFMSGTSLYSVGLNRSAGDGADDGSKFFGGVGVMLGKTRRIAIACDKVDGAKYFEAFRDLNNVLRHYGGETDMLHRFYQNVQIN